MNRAIKILITVAAISLIGTGSYFLVKKFLKDRRSTLAYKEYTPRPLLNEQRLPDGRTVRTYNEKDLEEARKKGQLPPGAQPVGPNQAATANEAAVQRTLQTIQEINKINEMNQRLQEQQQRMQRQNN